MSETMTAESVRLDNGMQLWARDHKRSIEIVAECGIYADGALQANGFRPATTEDLGMLEGAYAPQGLTAAAPDLLAACEALMEPMRRYREHGSWTVGDEKLLFAAHDAARAAISKAKGPTHAD